MRGLLLPGAICLAMCLHYATAQWPNWVLSKGVICEERCKKIKNCNPLNEFSACKCFPRQYLKKWLQYNTLPMEPHLVCLMSWSGVVPECCNIYKKQKDSYKNCASDSKEIEHLKTNHVAEIEEIKKGHGAEIEEMKQKLGSCGQDGGDHTSNLTAEMLVLILEQNRNQNQELEQLKKRLDNEQERTGQLEKRLDAEEDASERLSEQNSNQTQEMAQLEERLGSETKSLQKWFTSEQEERTRISSLTDSMFSTLTGQNQKLDKLTHAWSSEPWKPFATQLVNSASFSVHIGFSVYLTTWRTPTAEGIVKFNQKIINDGNGYSFSTGIFTCPVAGTYLFTFSVSAQGNHPIFLNLMLNGNSLVDGSADPKHSIVQSSTAALQRLRKGDRVYLASRHSGGNLVGDSRHKLNAFTGVLLHQ